MKEKTPRKIMGVVLVAALLVCSFPVPTGNGLLDRLRVQRAEAVPAVAVAAPVILATALAAYGVYVAGSSVGGYEANLDTFYQGMKGATDSYSASWAQYCAEKGSFDNALQSAVDGNGNIQLQVLADNGFFDSARSYSLVCKDNGSLVVGESSNDAMSTAFHIGDVVWVTQDAHLEYETVGTAAPSTHVLCAVRHTINTNGTSYFRYYYVPNDAVWTISDDRKAITYSGAGYSKIISVNNSVASESSFNSTSTTVIRGVLGSASNNLAPGYNPSFGNVVTDAGYSSVALGLGAISAGVVGGTAALPTSTVQPFEPTAEALEAGYSNADIIDAINTNTGTIEGISGTLDSILSGINPLAGILQAILTAVSPVAGILTGVQSIDGIMTGLQSTPFGWLSSWWNTLQGYWQTLLGVMGATPLGTLIGNVTTGISTLGTDLGSYLSGISTTLDSFWTGVGTWIGDTPIGQLVGSITTGIGGVIDALGSFKDAVLEWLGDTPIAALIRAILDAIDGIIAGDISLAGILEAIGAIPNTLAGALSDVLVGAIEGITFPTINFPRLTQEPGSGTVQIVGLPGDPTAEFDANIRNKAPFAYMVALGDLYSSLGSGYNSNPSFYFELDIPNAGEIRFDASPWLNYSVMGVSIAGLIRMMLTAFICVMMLGFVYKTMERAISK